MSVKLQNPHNAIIIEGLWTLGKTSIAQAYCNKYGYRYISEPWHTREDIEIPDSDIDTWYFDEHKKREKLIESEDIIFLDRSLLSTYAFRYALGRPLPDKSNLIEVKELIRKKSALIVYVKPEDIFFSSEEKDLEGYSDDVKSIIRSKELRARYEEWYTKILPLEYGITPFIVRIIKNGLRRPVEEIVKDINSALVNNRIAQVNIVCFKEDQEEGLKILTLKRNRKKGGFWQTITGGIHPGEGIREAAEREIKEETNLSLSEYEFFFTETKYFFEGNDGYILDEYVIACMIKDSKNLTFSTEHVSAEWLSFEDAQLRVKYENNKRAIQSSYKKISSSIRTA